MFACRVSWANDHKPLSHKNKVLIEDRLAPNNPTAHNLKGHVPSFSLTLIDVVQHSSVRVNLQLVLKLPVHEHGYIGIGSCSKFQAEL